MCGVGYNVIINVIYKCNYNVDISNMCGVGYNGISKCNYKCK